MSDQPTDRIEIGKTYEIFVKREGDRRAAPIDIDGIRVSNRRKARRHGHDVAAYTIDNDADAASLRSRLDALRKHSHKMGLGLTYEARVQAAKYRRNRR